MTKLDEYDRKLRGRTKNLSKPPFGLVFNLNVKMDRLGSVH